MRSSFFLIVFFFSTLVLARPNFVSSNLALESHGLSGKEFLNTQDKITKLSEVLHYTLGESVNKNNLIIRFSSHEKKITLVRLNKTFYELRLPKIMVHHTLSNESLYTIIQAYLLTCYTSKKLPSKTALTLPVLPEWFCAAIFYRTQAYINAPLQQAAIHPLMVNFFEKYPTLIPLDPENAVMLPVSSKSDIAYQVYAEWCDLILRYHFNAIPQTLNSKLIAMLNASRNVKNPNASSLYTQFIGENKPSRLSFSPANAKGVSKEIPFAIFVNNSLFQYDFHHKPESIFLLYKNLTAHLLYAEKIENTHEYTLKHTELKNLPTVFDSLYRLEAFKRYYAEQSRVLRLQAPLPLRHVLYKIETLVNDINAKNVSEFPITLNKLENELEAVVKIEKKRSAFFEKVAENSQTIDITKNAQLIYYLDTFSRTTQEKQTQAYLDFVERQFLYISNGKN